MDADKHDWTRPRTLACTSCPHRYRMSLEEAAARRCGHLFPDGSRCRGKLVTPSEKKWIERQRQQTASS